MENNKRLVSPDSEGNLVGEKGERLIPPKGWVFLPAGDAGITRKVTAKGNYWRVQVKMGKRLISKGIWAPSEIVSQAQVEVNSTRSTREYKKKREYELQRREKQQLQYEIDFCAAVSDFLHFHPSYKLLEQTLAKVIAEHAVPVGSGTVARTTMISIEERASKAVIAWMRHQTTAYDNLSIPHVKGERRAVRRKLAQQSVNLLNNYRTGEKINSDCPLWVALNRLYPSENFSVI